MDSDFMLSTFGAVGQQGRFAWDQAVLFFEHHWTSWAGALLVLLVGIELSRFLERAMGRFLTHFRVDEMLNVFLRKAVLWLVRILLAVVVLGLLGFDVTGFIAGLSALTFVLGFAAKDTLANFASGLVILFHKPFRTGDDVEVAGIRGTVVDIDISACNLRAEGGEFVMVPNSKIWGAPIKNYSRGKK